MAPPSQERRVAPVIAGFWERAEFPHELVPSFAELGLAGGGIKGYGCPVRGQCSGARGPPPRLAPHVLPRVLMLCRSRAAGRVQLGAARALCVLCPCNRSCLPAPLPTQGLGIVANAMAVIEIARVDASMSTFLLVHSYLAMLTIDLLVRGAGLEPTRDWRPAWPARPCRAPPPASPILITFPALFQPFLLPG